MFETIDTAHDFHKAYPFASVSYLGDRKKLSFSYAMRSSMPTYDQSNGFTYHNIEMLGVEGEPNLRPSIANHLQLKYRNGKFYVAIGWQHVSDYIAQSVESKRNEFFVNYSNIDRANLYSATINYHRSIKLWSAQFTASLRGQKIKFETYSFDDPIAEFNWNNQFQFPYGIIAMLNASYHTSGDMGTSWHRHFGQMDLSLTKETKNWTLQLKAEDVLRTAITRTIYYGVDSEYSRQCYSDNQRIQLTFRINLGTLSHHTLRSLKAGERERERM